MTELGAVVVGAGFGCLTHAPALRAAGFAVRALVGRDPRRTAERARRFDHNATHRTVAGVRMTLIAGTARRD